MLRNLTLLTQPYYKPKLLGQIARILPLTLSFIAGLIFSRGVLLQELYPFGLGYLGGICLGFPSFSLPALLGTALGYLSFLPLKQALVYEATLVCIYILLFRSGRGQEHPFIASLLAAAFHILTRGTYLLVTQGTLYEGVATGLEAGFIAIITLALWYTAQGYAQWKCRNTVSIEARCGMAVLMLGVLLGLEGLTFCGLDVQSIVSRFVLLWAASLGGPGGGAAVGVALGLLPVFQGSVPLGSVTFYAAAGLLAGSFRDFTKAGPVVGFVLANIFLAAYYAQSIILWRTLMETGIAAAFFCLMPVPWEDMRSYNTFALTAEEGDNAGQERLARLGEAFLDIQSLMVNSTSVAVPSADSDDLIEAVCQQVCEGCSLWKTCWRQNKERTGENILSCGRKYHELDNVTERDLDPEVLRRCPRSRELVAAIRHNVDRFSLMRFYERKLLGGRAMLAQQLVGLGHLIQDLSTEVGVSQQVCQEQKAILEKDCQKQGLPIQKVIPIEDEKGYGEIKVIQSPCKDRKRCRDQLLPLMAQSLGIPYEIKELSCPVLGGDRCVCTLIPKAVLEIEVGQALCPKAGQRISGDTAASFELPGRELGLVISDGMGAGPAAHEESTLALKLLERLLQTGLTSKMALKIVNTAMVLRTDKESFATLDLVIIDQVTGKTEFIKAGGAPSLIWSRGNFQVITAAMPPAGILDQFEPKSFTKMLYPKDVVISMSDGAWEALEALSGRGQWLDNLMQQLSLEKPDRIAEYLLYMAQSEQKDGCADDMCVQVARISQRNIA